MTLFGRLFALLMAAACGGSGNAEPPEHGGEPPAPAASSASAEAAASYRTAVERLAAEDYAGARGAAERAVALDAGQADYQEALGRACAGLGDHGCARAALAEALALDPARAELHARLGEEHIAAGDLAAAEEELRRALEVDEDDIPARLALVGVLVELLRASGDAAAAGPRWQEARRILIDEAPVEIADPPHAERQAELRRELDGIGEALGLEPEGPRTASTRERPAVGVARAVGGLRDRASTMPHVPGGASSPRGRPLEPDRVQAVIREHAREVQFCYERQFGERPDLEGAVVVEARIRPDGTVASARVESFTLSSPPMHACILQTFRRWRFPAAAAETHVVHPFRFGARGSGD